MPSLYPLIRLKTMISSLYARDSQFMLGMLSLTAIIKDDNTANKQNQLNTMKIHVTYIKQGELKCSLS